MKNSISIKIASLLLMLFLSFASFAQDNPSEPPEEEDVVQAPINDYIVPMLLAGAILGYAFIKRKAKEA